MMATDVLTILVSKIYSCMPYHLGSMSTVVESRITDKNYYISF